MRIFRFVSFVAAFVVILSVCAFAAEPVIITQPQNYYLPAGSSSGGDVSFSVLASGENLSYQWQRSTNMGETWNNLSTSTSNTSTLSIHLGGGLVNGKQFFRCIVSNTEGSVISQVVTVSVSAYVLDSLPQMLSWLSETGTSIFEWVGLCCTHIVQEPLLLFTVGFLAFGGSIAIVSRLLSRS